MTKYLICVFVLVLGLFNSVAAHSHKKIAFGSSARELKVRDCSKLLHVQLNKQLTTSPSSVDAEASTNSILLPLFENEEKEDDELSSSDTHLTIGNLLSSVYLYSSHSNAFTSNKSMLSSFSYFYAGSLRYLVLSSFRI